MTTPKIWKRSVGPGKIILGIKTVDTVFGPPRAPLICFRCRWEGHYAMNRRKREQTQVNVYHQPQNNSGNSNKHKTTRTIDLNHKEMRSDGSKRKLPAKQRSPEWQREAVILTSWGRPILRQTIQERAAEQVLSSRRAIHWPRHTGRVPRGESKSR